ncbi:MAG: NUDIX domain-containing protein [Rhabdochlamydiaceae bacterium]|jgi:8-oxo-dGTP pyrophosphatase MutT (NUDIX family)
MEKQFTASVYIIEEDKVLLLLHPKHKKWLPPGGHLEVDELPPECAKREALEETGLIVELIKEEHLWIDCLNATSFERPWLCLLEYMPPHGSQPAHQHIDFIYLGRAVGGLISEEHNAQHPIRWFSSEEILTLEPDREIFVETQQTIKKIFQTLRVCR